MSDIDLGPQLKPDDSIDFVERHAPALLDGEYTVSVEHTLTAGGSKALQARRPLSFVVAGPRFVLAPGEVDAMFPPPGASGDFNAVLPHVLLRRASLPWERSAVADERGATPWLALLVLGEKELLSSQVVLAQALVTPGIDDPLPAPGAVFATLSRGPGDDIAQAVQVIEISADLAATLLPRVDELSLLAGVREVNGADARALVVANRLPQAGQRNLVHLVSLEHQYRDASPPGPSPVHWAAGRLTGNVQLVSLARWDFACDKSAGHLAALLKNLTIGAFRFDPAKRKAARGPIEGGAVPVEHRLAGGQHTAAWYHGPLVTRHREPPLSLPARRADDLLLTESATGMADVSYATAWTLGRLLALRDPAVGMRLNQWKRQTAQAGLAARWIDLDPAPDDVGPSCPLFPLRDWFDTALARLAAVPFNHLVPEPKLLPPETICLLRIENAWIAALFDGAFSIGRHSAALAELDVQLRAALPPIGDASAVLLRSEAVASFPDLIVDGYASGGTKLLPILRFERLAKDTLLVLFAGRMTQVDLHLHPQAMHFGFDGDAQLGFKKHGLAVTLRAAKQGVVDIAALKTTLAVTGAHDFAARMLEGVPKASYSLSEVWHAA